MRRTFRVSVVGTAILLSLAATGLAGPLGRTSENTPGWRPPSEVSLETRDEICATNDFGCRSFYDRARIGEFKIAEENSERDATWTLIAAGLEWERWDRESEFPGSFLAEHDPSSFWWMAHHCRSNPEGCIRGGPGVNVDVPGADGGGRSHEYVGSVSTPTPAPTPEPFSVVLMGTFLSLAGGWARRKNRAA